MSNPDESSCAETALANPDSLLAAIIERHSHLYVDLGMCIGILLLTCCLVVAAHTLIDALH
jgi:hypothetical protein